MPTDPREIQEELFERDRALDRLERTREELIEGARKIRDSLLDQHPTVTSVEVVREMRCRGWGAALDAASDSRWLGAVFRRGQGLVRVGWRSIGSHGRPVAVWSRR